MMNQQWRIAVAVTLTVAILTGCQPRENPDQGMESVQEEPSVQESADDSKSHVILPDFSENVSAAYEMNTDTIGWLQVPGTDIADAVLHKPDDETNKYYERKDISRDYNFYGVYFADCTTTVGDSREELGVNTCIYGHTISDDPESEKYDIKFGQLHDFQDPEKAKRMPYIYYSNGKETFVFEVFAVFTANCDNKELPYNQCQQVKKNSQVKA